MSLQSLTITVIACMIGLLLARVMLRTRGGRAGDWSWRDGADDGDV